MVGLTKKFRSLWRKPRWSRTKDHKSHTELKIAEEKSRGSSTETRRHSEDGVGKHVQLLTQPFKADTATASVSKDIVATLPPVLPTISSEAPPWPGPFSNRTSEQSDVDEQVDVATSPPSRPPPSAGTPVPARPTTPPDHNPPSRAPLNPSTPVTTSPVVYPEHDSPAVLYHVSSLDHLASAYSSGRQSPEPESIFEPQVGDSKNSSPASTLRAEPNKYKSPVFPLSPAREDIVTAYVPKPLIIRPETVADSSSTSLEDSYTPLTKEEVRRMRARLSAISVSSYGMDENDPPPAPEPVTAVGPHDVNKFTADLLEEIQELYQSIQPFAEDEPPPIPPKSEKRQSIILAPAPDIVHKPEASPSQTTPPLPLPTPRAPIPRIRTQPKPNPAARNSVVSLPPSWLNRDPQRHDSLIDTSLSSTLHTYTRPKKTWYAIHERFLEIFDDAPTVQAGVRRENPKIYQMRKRRTLLEMGLTENDLNEPTDTKHGERIMKLLDGLEERLMREREEEARRNGVRERRQGRERRSVRFSTIEVHWADDPRDGYVVRDRKGKGKVVDRGSYVL